ncbi:MAG TPA: hypothetical protein VJR06_00830, partial [Nitrososphaerales archaeon]|nr:hypothetical protein [Nitrososphaerales archaeon]
MQVNPRARHKLIELASKPEVVFQPSEGHEWMSRSVAFHKLVEDRLFFSAKSALGRWQIGVADVDHIVKNPKKVELVGEGGQFFEAMTPNVVRTPDRFIMAFAGKKSRFDRRGIFLAVSDDLVGPFEVTGQSYLPNRPWEGRSIDLGPGNLTNGERVLFFYSSAFPRFRQVASGFLRSPFIPTPMNMMRYEERRIGILEVDGREPFSMKGSSNPLPLECTPGALSESVFCPGYAVVDRIHMLFMACSNYSRGFPFEQSIGVAESDRPPTEWEARQPIRPLITSKDLPAPFSHQAALDAPDAVVNSEGSVRLY